jgi:ABC-type hemin transport system ATPase subunit
MRYGIALLIAAVIIVALGLFAWQTRRQVEEQIRQYVLQQGDNADPANATDFAVKLPAGRQFRTDLARLLTSTWYAWVPIVIALCLACAWLVGRIRGR